MEYNKPIIEFAAGDEIEGFYVLKTAQVKTSNSGKPFLSASLGDKSGSVEAKMWDYNAPIGSAEEGGVVKIRGTVSEFRGSLQLILSRIRLPREDDPCDLGRLVPTAPLDVQAAWEELLEFADSLSDPDYRAVCQRMLEEYGDALRTLPAGKSMHHSFLSGLLMHTLYMLRIAGFLADLYQEVVDRDLLLAGTLLHDLAKREEFVTSSLGLVTEYSVKGQLLGHLVMGAQAVDAAARELGVPEEKAVLLEHLLLSHHGEPEFGAAVRPMCAESELLSLIDLVDSRMEIYRETLAETVPGQFSKRVFALEKRVYRHDGT